MSYNIYYVKFNGVMIEEKINTPPCFRALYKEF